MNLKKRWKLQRDLRKAVAKVFPGYDVKEIKIKKASEGDVLIRPFDFYADENVRFTTEDNRIKFVAFSNEIQDNVFEIVQEITLTKVNDNFEWDVTYNVPLYDRKVKEHG